MSTMVTNPAATELIVHTPAGERWQVQRATVRVTAGPDRGQSVALAKGATVVIGTGEECDLVLSDAAASRRHCEIATTDKGFVLRDFGSTNGTTVAGLEVREVVLKSGSKIGLGRTTLVFKIAAGHDEHPLSPHEQFGELLGRSAPMRHCFELLETAALSDSTVLLEGETGVGKELAARGIHAASTRADGPFVVVDCGAVSASLLESELFGHERGAFTGAIARHTGAFEQAHSGTVFLDEIGELELGLQPKLLRFLERREVRRLGGQQMGKVDVRVIAATHRNLEQMVGKEAFRSDLFYRLAVLRIRLPALRERPSDIPMLASHLALRLRPEEDPKAWLNDEALALFERYLWPGNVRELRNVIERLALLPRLDPSTLFASPNATAGGLAGPANALHGLSYHEAKERVLTAFERQYLNDLLTSAGGVVAQAAERAGVPRQTFFRLIKKHGLRGT